MAPGYVFQVFFWIAIQIFFWIAIQNQIGITKWVIINEVVQL